MPALLAEILCGGRLFGSPGIAPMYERFTDRARRIMQLANQEAKRFKHEYIGTEHILLGLVKEGSGVAAHVLTNLGIDLRKVRLEVEKLVPSGPDIVTLGGRPQMPRAKEVIMYSMEEARNLRHNYVGSEHLLLGLLRAEEGVAAQVLMNLGLTLERARAEVLKLLGVGMTERRKGLSREPPVQSDELAVVVVTGRGNSGEPPLESTGDPAKNVEEPPAACPQCGGSRVVRILSNCVFLSGEDRKDVAAERAILAGKVTRQVPSWACLDCEPRWSEVHRLAFQDYQWQLAKEEAVANQDWETAARLRDAQYELRPRLAALVEQLLGRP
jgi:hypothetical protein